MMQCQGEGCEAWGAIGQTLFPVEDGKFQGKPKYSYLCKRCAEKPPEPHWQESEEPEYPF